MRRITFLASARSGITWNVGIDFPNGIRDLDHFKEKIESPGIPDTLAFHSPKGINDVMCQEVLLWILEEDKRRGYTWTPTFLILDFTYMETEAVAERMMAMSLAHFQEKHKALNLPSNFIT